MIVFLFLSGDAVFSFRDGFDTTGYTNATVKKNGRTSGPGSQRSVTYLLG